MAKWFSVSCILLEWRQIFKLVLSHRFQVLGKACALSSSWAFDVAVPYKRAHWLYVCSLSTSFFWMVYLQVCRRPVSLGFGELFWNWDADSPETVVFVPLITGHSCILKYLLFCSNLCKSKHKILSDEACPQNISLEEETVYELSDITKWHNCVLCFASCSAPNNT